MHARPRGDVRKLNLSLKQHAIMKLHNTLSQLQGELMELSTNKTKSKEEKSAIIDKQTRISQLRGEIIAMQLKKQTRDETE